MDFLRKKDVKRILDGTFFLPDDDNFKSDLNIHELLKSFLSITQRKGVDTNWEALEKNIVYHLSTPQPLIMEGQGKEVTAMFEISAPVDWDSEEMKEAIGKLKLEIAEIMEGAKVDTTKMHITFNKKPC